MGGEPSGDGSDEEVMRHRQKEVTSGHLLDASALLALLLNEPGADRVEAVLEDGQIHAVNLAEAAKKLAAKGWAPERLKDLELEVGEVFGVDQAYLAGKVIAANRKIGLSLGDAICLVVAAWHRMKAVTAETAWEDCAWPEDADIAKPEIVLIR